MGASKNCQAAVPAKCKYHGVSSATHTKMLKNKLSVATQTYQALKKSPHAYTAYSAMREAQNDYYATDQGLFDIENAMNRSELTPEQDSHIRAIYKTAMDTRLAHERSVTSASAFMPSSPKPYKALPPGTVREVNQSDEMETINLSTFMLPNGELLEVDYIEKHSLVILTSNHADPTVIAKANNQEEAIYKATSWYNHKY